MLRAGLWEESEKQISLGEAVDWPTVYRLAREQAVLGLVLAGINRLPAEQQPPLKMLMRSIGEIQALEKMNLQLNAFVEGWVEKFHDSGIRVYLIKGQGIAQCYERPLWRSCGDADFFLSQADYVKAKSLIIPTAEFVKQENTYSRHQAIRMGRWTVELHGSLRGGLSTRIDKNLDEIGEEILSGKNPRYWMAGNTQVSLPDVNDDAVYVFTHILKHFYKGGIGLRQICDWCRLIWTYRAEIDRGKLEKRLERMGLITEWKSFAALVVNVLGMPAEAMPLYDASERFSRKANRIGAFVLAVGNFGSNREGRSADDPFVKRKAVSFGRRCADLIRHARIFPLDSFRFLPRIMINGFEAAAKGK